MPIGIVTTKTPAGNPLVVCTIHENDKHDMILEFDFPQITNKKDRIEAQNIILATRDGELVAQSCIAENAFLLEDIKAGKV